MRTDQVAKIGNVGCVTLAAKKRPAKLLSRSLMARDKEGWATLQSSLARVKFSWSANARKYRTWCISMTISRDEANTIIEHPTPKVTTCRYGIVQFGTPT